MKALVTGILLTPASTLRIRRRSEVVRLVVEFFK